MHPPLSPSARCTSHTDESGTQGTDREQHLSGVRRSVCLQSSIDKLRVEALSEGGIGLVSKGALQVVQMIFQRMKHPSPRHIGAAALADQVIRGFKQNIGSSEVVKIDA